MSKNRLLTLREACEYLCVSRTTLLKSEDEDLITPARTVGGHRRYLKKDLDMLIRATTGLKLSAKGETWGERRQIVFPQIVERLAVSLAPVDDIMKEVLSNMIKLLQADAGFIALIDDQNVLCLRMAVGLFNSFQSDTKSIPLDSSISGRVLKLRQPLVYGSSEGDITLDGMTQGVCAPLAYRGTLLGVIHVQSLSRHQFLPSEVSFLSLITFYLASLIINSQLLINSKQREEEWSCLNKLVHTMQKQKDLDSIAMVLLNEITRITNAEVGVVFLCDDTSEVRVAASQGDSLGLNTQLANKLKFAVTKVLDSNEPHLILSFSQFKELGIDFSPSFTRMNSLVIFPLRWEGEKLGAFLLGTGHPRDAGDWHIRFLTTVSAQASLVIQRAALCLRLSKMGENERLLRSYYEQMVAVSPVTMEIIDKNNKIIAWNEAAEELTGIPREEALDADKFVLQPWLLRHNGREILASVVKTKQVLKMQKFPYERRDGTIRYLDLTFLPFCNNSDKVTAVIVFAQDVTELEALRAKSECGTEVTPPLHSKSPRSLNTNSLLRARGIITR